MFYNISMDVSVFLCWEKKQILLRGSTLCKSESSFRFSKDFSDQVLWTALGINLNPDINLFIYSCIHPSLHLYTN